MARTRCSASGYRTVPYLQAEARFDVDVSGMTPSERVLIARVAPRSRSRNCDFTAGQRKLLRSLSLLVVGRSSLVSFAVFVEEEAPSLMRSSQRTWNACCRGQWRS